jgi:hypothetical protein
MFKQFRQFKQFKWFKGRDLTNNKMVLREITESRAVFTL